MGYDPEQVNALLNKRSGMLGLTGFSDMRDIIKAVEQGDEEAQLACHMYAYRIKKYIGAYAAVLNHPDAVVFTAGVGENDARMRQHICDGMNHTGIILDQEKNNIRSGKMREVSTDDSKIKVLVIPTNEELEIAMQCFKLLKS